MRFNRIVTMNPGIAEMVCLCGKGESLAAISPYTTRPAGILHLPRLSPYGLLTVEELRIFRPDLVIADHEVALPLLEGMQADGVETCLLPGKTLDDFFVAAGTLIQLLSCNEEESHWLSAYQIFFKGIRHPSHPFLGEEVPLPKVYAAL
jgi:ABC-type hemin transport system substrate-binding protein